MASLFQRGLEKGIREERRRERKKEGEGKRRMEEKGEWWRKIEGGFGKNGEGKMRRWEDNI